MKYLRILPLAALLFSSAAFPQVVAIPQAVDVAGMQQQIAEAKAIADQAAVTANAADNRSVVAMSRANTANTTAATASATPGPKGDKGDTGAASTVPGPAGAASTVPGPAGPASTVPGPAGSSATITIGSVTTTAAGTAATVTNAGTSSAAVFNFTLPRGTAGQDGAAGATGGAGPAGPSGATFLGNVTIAQTATVALPLGPRTVTVALAGCLVGERILLTPLAAMPAGYGILDASCFTAGVLSVNIYGPALIIGGAYSIAAKTTVFR